MIFNLLVSSVLLAEALAACGHLKCGAGQYYDQARDTCEACGVDEWMELNNHSCLSCRKCDRMDDRPNEDIVEMCSRTHNIKTKRKENYSFRRNKCIRDMEVMKSTRLPSSSKESTQTNNFATAKTKQVPFEKNIFAVVVIGFIRLLV